MSPPSGSSSEPSRRGMKSRASTLRPGCDILIRSVLHDRGLKGKAGRMKKVSSLIEGKFAYIWYCGLLSFCPLGDLLLLVAALGVRLLMVDLVTIIEQTGGFDCGLEGLADLLVAFVEKRHVGDEYSKERKCAEWYICKSEIKSRLKLKVVFAASELEKKRDFGVYMHMEEGAACAQHVSGVVPP